MVHPTIVHFEIPANDVAKISKFYSESFGWKIEKSGMEAVDYWLIRTGPQEETMGGGIYQKMDSKDSIRNYIGEDNIDGAIEKFKKAGGTGVHEKAEIPGEGWSFMGKDPEDNLIGIFQAKEKM